VNTENIVLSPLRPISRRFDDSALYDFRIYDVKPFAAPEYAALLAEVLPVRERHSTNFCIWQPATGPLDRIVHLWPYDSIEQRMAVRASVAREPEWGEFVSKVFPLLVRQQSSLLRPVTGLEVE
jgi:hypothetical protein